MFAQVGLEPPGRDQLGRSLVAEVVDPFRPPDHEHVAVGDLPAEPRLLERFVDRVGVLVEHDAEAVPGHLTHAEHAVVVGESVRHVVSFRLSMNVVAGARGRLLRYCE